MTDELENIKISELPYLDSVDAKKDFVPAVHFSDAYSEGEQTVKVHPTAFTTYDNSKSGLHARTIQAAIDELSNRVKGGGLTGGEMTLYRGTYTTS
jgi:hypothetical protein